MKKYELTDETVWVGSRTLYRVRALCDIPGRGVQKGDTGGFVETEQNLNQFGAAWVSGAARVSGDARVFGDAWVSGNARVFGTEILYVTGLPSGIVTMFPTTDGWTLTIGCWSGTVDELEAMIAGDDWPESEGDEQVLRRPGLEALVTLCRAHVGLVEARKEQEK